MNGGNQGLEPRSRQFGNRLTFRATKAWPPGGGAGVALFIALAREAKGRAARPWPGSKPPSLKTASARTRSHLPFYPRWGRMSKVPWEKRRNS